MYNLQFLPVARNDMVEIVRYIGNDLQNKQAANKLADDLIDAAEKLREFPYAYPAFSPIRPTKKDYRKLVVRNYIIFYWVDESSKTVTVSRVVYAKRDYEKFLK